MLDLPNELLEQILAQLPELENKAYKMLLDGTKCVYMENVFILNQDVIDGYKTLDLAGKICGILSFGNRNIKEAYKKEKANFSKRMKGELYITGQELIFRGKAYDAERLHMKITEIRKEKNSVSLLYGREKENFVVQESTKLCRLLLLMMNSKCRIFNCYYYNELLATGVERYVKAYIEIYLAMAWHEEVVILELPKSEKKILERILLMVLADHPDLYYVTLNGTRYCYERTVVRIYFKYVSESLLLQTIGLKETMEGTKEIVEEKVCYLIREGKKVCKEDEEELIKWLYTYLVENVSYAGERLKNMDKINQCLIHSALGALCLEKAVCDGIARAFKMLLDELGIENWIVRRSIKEDMEYSHEWNAVKFGKEIRYMDITWEIDLYSVNRQVKYEFYNLTEEQMEAKHAL